tara:strand:+ start:322 stop:510 length:189 start_codon:yes stop_codon:yes gene_type:complete
MKEQTLEDSVGLDKLMNIIKDIRDDDEWVVDSHSQSHYNGGLEAMARILEHIAELRQSEGKE